MTDPVIVPTADAIVQPVVDKIVALRPNSAPYLNARTGAYWHPVLGFRGQAAAMLERLATLVAARRLKTAQGTELLDYVASEFDAVPDLNPTYAFGFVTLGRGTDPALPGGAYPAGTRVTRQAYNALGVEIPAAEYVTLTAAPIDANSTATVTVPVQAVSTGEAANHPLLLNTDGGMSNFSVPSTVANVIVADFEAGGGSKGAPSAANGNITTIDEDWDKHVRAFAKTYAKGQYGPTADASRLGALSASGVRHFLVYDDPVQGAQTILVADPSWGSSDHWAGLVQQSIYDANLVGFGCKVTVAKIRSRVITANVEVSLRDQTWLADTTGIDTAIQTAVRSYFDDRPLWNTWDLRGLQAAIALAHPRVYQCKSATILDASTGIAVPEIVAPDYSTEQVHNFLAANSMKISYVGPGG